MNGLIHPQLLEHGTFAGLRLGRNRSPLRPGALKLADYLDKATLLPAIPETFDNTPPVTEYPMYDNDRLGDCTIAAAAHLIQMWSAAAGDEKTPLDSDVDAMYWETGQPPAETGEADGPTDNGRDEQDVLAYWQQTGLGGDKTAGSVSVDTSSPDELRTALYLFGGLYTGVELPTTAQTQPEWEVVGDGQTGDSAPGSWGGHAVPWLPKWDGQDITLVTWGATLVATLGFVTAYFDQAFAVVSPDYLNARAGEVSPAGFDLAQLLTDLTAF